MAHRSFRRLLPRVALAALLLPACSLLEVQPRPPAEPDYGRPLPPGEMALEKVTDPALYPDFGCGFGERDTLLRAIDGTLAYFAKPSSRRYFPYLDITHERAVRSLELFRRELLDATSGEDLHRRIVEKFEVYRSKGWDGSGTVLFTGYCQPIYDASPVRTDRYRYPLYALPPELVKDEDGTPLGWRRPDGTIGPSPTRADFDAGLLEGRGLELFWLADPLEVYVIHVQGSAKLRMPDGSLRSVGYAGKTERPYVGLGRALVEDGKIPRGKLSLFAIRRYFAEHPEERDAYLRRNESYVFFTEIEGGPYGSLNIEVTPYRTLATDKKVFPRGGLCFVETRLPDETGRQRPFCGFLLDQDTGGAIRSAGRADIFVGTGPEAERIAGSTYSEGRLYYIFARGEGTREPLASEARKSLSSLADRRGSSAGSAANRPAALR